MDETPIYNNVNDETDVERTNFTPTISDKTRTIAYFVAGIGIPTVGFVAGVAALWFPDAASSIATTALLADTFIGTVAGVFGIVNRPTKYKVIK